MNLDTIGEKIDDIEGHVIRTKWGKGYFFGNLEE